MWWWIIGAIVAVVAVVSPDESEPESELEHPLDAAYRPVDALRAAALRAGALRDASGTANPEATSGVMMRAATLCASV